VSRFVVLEHDSARGRHWDFLLETGSVLATWALSEPPDSGGVIVCEALGDHRREYLDYEGPISGSRGSVTRWDRGTYVLQHRCDTQVVVTLDGQRLSGRATLSRMPDEPASWRFSLETT